MPVVAKVVVVRGAKAGVQGLKKTVQTEVSTSKAEMLLLKDEIHERNKAKMIDSDQFSFFHIYTFFTSLELTLG